MENILIYDIEIEKAIPPKSGEVFFGIAYCEGWQDYENMGVSCVCTYSYVEKRYRVFCHDNMADFFSQIARHKILIGFNNIEFDNSVLSYEAHSAGLYETPGQLLERLNKKSYDLLKEIWIAAGIKQGNHQGYTLDKTVKANGYPAGKTGNGADAPILWQHGKIGQVIDYCLNDVKITRFLLEKVFMNSGKIIDPKTGGTITLRFPEHNEINKLIR